VSIITVVTEDSRITIDCFRPPSTFQEVLVEPIVPQPAASLMPGDPIDVPATGRFTKIGSDGRAVAPGTGVEHVAVVDNTTGLMWSIESLGNLDDADDGITQEHCIERCRELRLLDHDDWRLPTRVELAGLIDDSRHDPAIDTEFFPNVKPRWHWTSTAAAWSSASAWFVDFNSGGVYDLPRSYDGFALAVRRAGQ